MTVKYRVHEPWEMAGRSYIEKNDKVVGLHEIADILNSREWVSVEDALPKNENEVTVYMYNPHDKESNSWIDKGSYKSYWHNVGCCNVTHWMNLPPTPK